MIETEPKVEPKANYSARRAAELLGVSIRTIYAWTKANKLPFSVHRITGKQVYKGSELLKAWNLMY